MSDTANTTPASESPVRSGPGTASLAMFLGSAVVLFGAILTGYGLLRFNDPGAFAWAPKLLDRRLGLAGAAALLVVCVAASGAARFALAGKTGLARLLLGVALAAGAAVLVVRGVEYPATALRAGFLPRTEAVPGKDSPRSAAAGALATASALAPADPAHGKSVYLKTCAACHAPDGSGVKGQGANLRESDFVKGRTDAQLLAFVKVGRQPFDPETKLHLTMPGRGGNPALTDQDLVDAIFQVRELQKAGAAAAVALVSAGESKAAKIAPPAAAGSSADQPQIVEGELWLPHSILPAANPGPVGSRSSEIALQKPGAASRAVSNLRRFFSIVLFLNGLHAIYLVFGLALGVWTISSAGQAAASRTAFALVAVYWIVIAGIGLVLVPALYL